MPKNVIDVLGTGEGDGTVTVDRATVIGQSGIHVSVMTDEPLPLFLTEDQARALAAALVAVVDESNGATG